MRRRTARRRVHRRRRHNPALLRGVTMPNFGQVLTAVAGGTAAKIGGKMLFPQGATMLGGWGGPLTTLGAGIALGFILKAVKMGRYAGSVVSGAATIAAYDALKLTPLAPQLGAYAIPGGYTPVLSGVGSYPPGFADPSLSGGDMNAADGFESNPY